MTLHSHVLVIESNPLRCELICSSLVDHYRVSSVSTVGEARAFLRTSHIDLMIVASDHPDGPSDALADFAKHCSVTAIFVPHTWQDYAKLPIHTVGDLLRSMPAA
jgi:DNA-binding response OmpR family regulator